MSFDQGQFNFDAKGGEEGYRHWREELDRRRRAFESRWGVILGTRVRLQLRDHARAVEGTITLIEDGSAAQKQHPHLRIGSLHFSPAEIESVIRLDDAP